MDVDLVVFDMARPEHKHFNGALLVQVSCKSTFCFLVVCGH